MCCLSASGRVKHTGPWHVWSQLVTQLHTEHRHTPHRENRDGPIPPSDSRWASFKCEAIDVYRKRHLSERGHLGQGACAGIPANGPGKPEFTGTGLGGLPLDLGLGLLSTSPHERREHPRPERMGTAALGARSVFHSCVDGCKYRGAPSLFTTAYIPTAQRAFTRSVLIGDWESGIISWRIPVVQCFLGSTRLIRRRPGACPAMFA